MSKLWPPEISFSESSVPKYFINIIHPEERDEQNGKVLIDEGKVKIILDYESAAQADWNDFNCVDFTCFLWYKF